MRLFPAAPSGGVLIWGGNAYTLTQVEYQILDLILKANTPVPACDIGAEVFPRSPVEGQQRMVSSYVARLRKKVGSRVIDAGKGGYQFAKEETQSSESAVQGSLWLRERPGA